MKRFLKILMTLCLCCMCMFPAVSKAAGTAHFYVQTADVQDDGTLNVTVYLTDAENMGGVEAELIYDPSKVSFVEARLGASLKTELADIYHNENKSLVKYVALYQEAQNPHGALMQVTFQLKEGDSYQPQLNVVGLVDDSVEVKDIPFSVSYQHADGSWSEEQDTTGVKAEKSVIEEALENYGAKEDQQETNGDGTSADSAVGKEETGNTDTSDTVSSGNNDATENVEISEKEKQDGRTQRAVIGIAVSVVAIAIVVGVVVYVIRKKKKSE